MLTPCPGATTPCSRGPSPLGSCATIQLPARARPIPCHGAFATTLCEVTAEPPDRQLRPLDGRAPASPNANDDIVNDASSPRRTVSWRSPGTWLPRAPARATGPAAPTDRPAAGILDEREHRFSVAASVRALGLVAATPPSRRSVRTRLSFSSPDSSSSPSCSAESSSDAPRWSASRAS
jgi:hypothetical protein